MREVRVVDMLLGGRPGRGAAHLVMDDGRAIVVDPGPQTSASLMLLALEEAQVPRDAVDYLLITHVHLDHAGGTGALLADLPHAQVLAHPRAVRHLADPSRLLAGATEVYGAKMLADLYGQVLPVPPDRLFAAEDGSSLSWQGCTFRFLDAPGHARHHMVILEEKEGWVFSGDAFGVSYRETDLPKGVFIFPTTTPNQFDPRAMQKTIRKIGSLGAKKTYLTHFGGIGPAAPVAEELCAWVDRFVALTQEASQENDPLLALEEKLLHGLMEAAKAQGVDLGDKTLEETFSSDARLNAQGLWHWWQSQKPS